MIAATVIAMSRSSAVEGSLEGSRGGRVYVHDRDELGDRVPPLSGAHLDRRTVDATRKQIGP